MGFQIEIIEGHDTSSYFWFRPVILKEKGKFLYKYFDKNLTYNKRRYE